MHRISFVLVAIASVATVAHAGDSQYTLADECFHYINSLVQMKHDPVSGPDKNLTIASCDAVVARIHAANIPDDTQLSPKLTFGQMPAVCAEFATWHRIAEAAKVLWDADEWNDWLTAIDIAENHEENQEKLVESSARCTSELDRLVKEGMPTDVTIWTRVAHDVKIADGKEKICAPLAKAAKTFAKSVTKAREEKLAALAAPYKKIGITGDRLQVCMDWDGIVLRGVGGGELSSPKARKTASIMFATLGPASDTGLITIRRFAFRGDKLTSVTEKQYVLMPGAAGYR